MGPVLEACFAGWTVAGVFWGTWYMLHPEWRAERREKRKLKGEIEVTRAATSVQRIPDVASAAQRQQLYVSRLIEINSNSANNRIQNAKHARLEIESVQQIAEQRIAMLREENEKLRYHLRAHNVELKRAELVEGNILIDGEDADYVEHDPVRTAVRNEILRREKVIQKYNLRGGPGTLNNYPKECTPCEEDLEYVYNSFSRHEANV